MTRPRATDLDVIQRWMLSVITHPGGIEAGILSPPATAEIDLLPEQIEQVIPRSQACTSLERLAVYGNAYFARLIECLQAEFPAVRHAVGEDAFARFAVGYLQHVPPHSYTLGELGTAFPQYLEETRPASDGDQLGRWPEFLIDLARLERIYSEVFDGPGEERLPLLSAEELRAVPPDCWGDIRLQTSASLRLVEFRFPVHEYITAVRHGRSAEFPEPAPTWLAVNRRDYIVRRQLLSHSQFVLLGALHSGHSLGEAIEDAVNLGEIPLAQLGTELESWFRNWTAGGYFREVVQGHD